MTASGSPTSSRPMRAMRKWWREGQQPTRRRCVSRLAMRRLRRRALALAVLLVRVPRRRLRSRATIVGSRSWSTRALRRRPGPDAAAERRVRPQRRLRLRLRKSPSWISPTERSASSRVCGAFASPETSPTGSRSITWPRERRRRSRRQHRVPRLCLRWARRWSSFHSRAERSFPWGCVRVCVRRFR